jgi:hypothetical protein
VQCEPADLEQVQAGRVNLSQHAEQGRPAALARAQAVPRLEPAHDARVGNTTAGPESQSRPLRRSRTLPAAGEVLAIRVTAYARRKSVEKIRIK